MGSGGGASTGGGNSGDMDWLLPDNTSKFVLSRSALSLTSAEKFLVVIIV
jgi:hypothetical protein